MSKSVHSGADNRLLVQDRSGEVHRGGNLSVALQEPTMQHVFQRFRLNMPTSSSHIRPAGAQKWILESPFYGRSRS